MDFDKLDRIARIVEAQTVARVPLPTRALVLHDLIEVASQLSVRPDSEQLCGECFKLIAEMGMTTHDECTAAARLIEQARATLAGAA